MIGTTVTIYNYIYILILILVSSSYFGFLSLIGFDEHVQHGGWSVQLTILFTYVLVFYCASVKSKVFISKVYVKSRLCLFCLIGIILFYILRDFYLTSSVYFFKNYISMFLYFVFAILLLDEPVNARFKIFRGSFLINIAIQILFILVFTDVAYHKDVEHFGRFKGSFSHKNALASILLCQFFLYISHYVLVFRSFQSQKFARVELVLIVLFFFMFIYLSQSMTVLVCAFLVCFIFLMPTFVFSRLFIFTIISALSVLSFFLISYLGLYLESFGRDLTFTGRILIWPMVIEAINEKLYLGYGYMWFWVGGEVSNYTNLDWIIEFGNAHNYFLEFVLSYGLLGMLITIILLVFKFNSSRVYNKFYTSFLLFFVVYGLFESAFFYVNNYQMLLMFFILLSSTKSLQKFD